MNYYYYINNSNISNNSIIQQAPKLITFSRKTISANTKNPRHMHSHLEVFYYVDGEGTFDINNEQHPIKKGLLAIINSNNTHIQYPKHDKTLTFYVLSIDGLQLYGLPNNSISMDKGNFKYFDNDDNVFLKILDEMLVEQESQQKDYYSKTVALLYQLLVEIKRTFVNNISASETIDSTPAVVYRVKNYIDSHFMENITLDSLIKIAYLNKSYFLKQFKKNYSISPMQYLTSVRLQHSQLLLSKTELSISEVAYSLHFNNSSYFSEIFKKNFSITPSEFRKKTITNKVE